MTIWCLQKNLNAISNSGIAESEIAKFLAENADLLITVGLGDHCSASRKKDNLSQKFLRSCNTISR
jgi:hypothetical protein